MDLLHVTGTYMRGRVGGEGTAWLVDERPGSNPCTREREILADERPGRWRREGMLRLEVSALPMHKRER
jgi:hypothetical protein